MFSVVIILLLWLARKFLFGSDLFVEMLDYKFVRNDKQELNIYLSNKQTRFNIDQTLSSLVILGLKNLIFRIQFQFIKNECNKKKIFKLFSIRLLVVIKLLLAAYIMFVYALKPSTPDLDIKEINGSYYYFRTDCVMEDVSRTGRIIKDCEEYAIGNPLSDQQIKPSVSARRPYRRAGTTRESFTTMRSSGWRILGKSRMFIWRIDCVARFKTSSRAAARSASGSCAIDDSGRS